MKVGKLESLKLKIEQLTHEWHRDNDMCKFQVATVHRLGGVLGTDRYTHVFSINSLIYIID